MNIMSSLFIFHRDLSINDNTGLINCLENSENVYCIFIFTPEQIDKNKYFSMNSFTFMINSLKELSEKIHLSFFYEPSEKCISRLIDELNINAVYENADFSPFARSRQEAHKKICDKKNILYSLENSITLAPMGVFIKKNPYVKFTPFYEYAITKKIQEPQNLMSSKKISNKKIGTINLSIFDIKPTKEGGRIQALKLLTRFEKIAHKYEKHRNYPYLNATSNLSAHLHFGTVTPREVYYRLKKHKEFIKQLYWREFYMYISNYITKDYTKKSWTQPRFNKIVWNDNTHLKKWKEGRTGIPLVDAGMRELLNTGHMHNRLRMICAMYLIHYLGIHWTEGERWFAQNLTDYSYSNNWGGWVWCASIEIHSNPYFRIFSIEEQNKRFDPDCLYIKKWIKEYKNLTKEEIFEKYAGLSEIRKKRIAYLKSL